MINYPIISKDEKCYKIILKRRKYCAVDFWPKWIHNEIFHSMLELIKADLMAAVSNFHLTEMFEKSFMLHLVLTPKDSGTKELGDFRSINLIGGFYKLI